MGQFVIFQRCPEAREFLGPSAKAEVGGGKRTGQGRLFKVGQVGEKVVVDIKHRPLLVTPAIAVSRNNNK